MRDGAVDRPARVRVRHKPTVPAPERGLEPLDESDLEALAMRPRRRSECGTERPCPWVGCEHHMAISELVRVTPKRARIRWLNPDLEVWEMPHTCLLDLVEQHGGKMTLEEVAKIFGVTRERIRQLEAKGLRKAKAHARRRHADRAIIEDLQELDGCRPGLSPLAQAAETEEAPVDWTAAESRQLRRAVAALDRRNPVCWREQMGPGLQRRAAPIEEPLFEEPPPRFRPERPAEPETRPSAPPAPTPVLEPPRRPRRRRLWTREQRREVESWLWITSSRNEPQTTTELATLGDLSPRAAGALLRRLEREGRVERVAGRRWRMPLEEASR